MSDENITATSAPYNFLNLSLGFFGTKVRVRFSGSLVKARQNYIRSRTTVNMYIVYEINKYNNTNSDPTLENCLFGAVSLTKNTNIGRYKYSGYGIGFDRHGSYSYPSGGTGRNVITFGVDMSSATKIYNRKKEIFIFGKDPTQGLEHTLSAEQMYSINFTEKDEKFCLSLHYNGTMVKKMLMVKKNHKFKAKDPEIVATPLCLGNISKDWTADNMKKTGLNGYVYDVIVDHDAIAVDDILDIQNYLMKKNDIV